MSIQSSTNSLFGSVAALLSINPTLRMKAEERMAAAKLGRKEDVLKKQYKTVAGETADIKPGEKVDPDSEADDVGLTKFTKFPDIKQATRIEDSLAEIKQAQFELNPTEETYAAALRGEYGEFDSLTEESRRVNQFRQNIEKAAKKAEDALVTKQEEKRAGRRSFLEYMKDEPTSLGVSFGQLDPKLQKELAKDYSKSERKNIMDRKDAMKNEQK